MTSPRDRFALCRKDNWITFNENEILSDLPVSLRADVVTFVQRHNISKVPWFEGKDPSFVADVAVNLKSRIFRVSGVFPRKQAKCLLLTPFPRR